MDESLVRLLQVSRVMKNVWTMLDDIETGWIMVVLREVTDSLVNEECEEDAQKGVECNSFS